MMIRRWRRLWLLLLLLLLMRRRRRWREQCGGSRGRGRGWPQPVNSHSVEVDMAIGKRRLVQRCARELPRPGRVLVAFIQMNELLVPDEKITDVHVSKCRPNASRDSVSVARRWAVPSGSRRGE
jgi:hypothetical protein